MPKKLAATNLLRFIRNAPAIKFVATKFDNGNARMMKIAENSLCGGTTNRSILNFRRSRSDTGASSVCDRLKWSHAPSVEANVASNVPQITP